MQKNTKKILLTGGGTGGSVAPLLAAVEELRDKPPSGFRATGWLWLGTKSGLEKQMVEKENIEFKPIFSGKFRRYFSLRNFVDLIFIFLGFIQSFFIILKSRPNLVMSAGSFVSVPVVWAAWILRVPVLIHQQDVRPGLANKLMAPFAKIITVTFEQSLVDYGKKAVWTGNPTRITNYELRITNIKDFFGFKEDLPVVLVVGGGTGAMAINELVEKKLEELTKFCQVIHITGKNKTPNYNPEDSGQITNYKNYEFLNSEQIANAYAAADIVVSRAGMGVLTELSYLGKPSILIPMPDSHQEDNAEIFKKNQAAIVLNQKDLTAEQLVENIKNLLCNRELREKLSNNVKIIIKRGANKKIVEIIERITRMF